MTRLQAWLARVLPLRVVHEGIPPSRVLSLTAALLQQCESEEQAEMLLNLTSRILSGGPSFLCGDCELHAIELGHRLHNLHHLGSGDNRMAVSSARSAWALHLEAHHGPE